MNLSFLQSAVFNLGNIQNLLFQPTLETIKTFNIDDFLGEWIECARLPNSFEYGASNVTATYTKIKNSLEVSVLNQATSDRTQGGTIEGTAVVAAPGKLLVTFYGVPANYWIIELNSTYMIVTDPTKDFLWILSRTEKLSDEKLKDVKEKLRTVYGFGRKVDEMINTQGSKTVVGALKKTKSNKCG
jgi:apolipoprotein D and lipocalin family protein